MLSERGRMLAMKVELLYFDGCPNWTVTEQRLRTALDLVGVSAGIEHCQVDSQEQAKRHRFAGSPSIRINGKDPFLSASAAFELTCRDLLHSGWPGSCANTRTNCRGGQRGGDWLENPSVNAPPGARSPTYSAPGDTSPRGKCSMSGTRVGTHHRSSSRWQRVIRPYMRFVGVGLGSQ